MKELFLQTINMSINASYLILAILMIRFIFKSLPKTSRIILWIIVGLRLICPFTIESVFSVIPTKEIVYITDTIQPELIINTGNQQVNDTIQQTITSVAPSITENNTMIDITSIISIIWIIGIVLFIGYSTYSVIQLKNKIKESVLLKDNIYLCDHIDACFVFGIFNPKIYLPSSINNEDLKYIIAHEKAHIQRKDYVYKPLAFLLLSIHWFNPIVWIAYKCFCNDLELACDEKVLVDFGLESKKEYSNTLINYSDQTHLGVCPLAFSENNVKSRVVSILKYKKPNKWIIAIGGLICAVFIACFMTNPKEIKTRLVKYKPNENLESIATVDDIEGWDIPLEEVKSVVVKSNIYNGGGTREVTLSKEEATQLIQAFNAIQNKDILEIYTEALYGPPLNCSVIVETKNDQIILASDEIGYLWHKDIYYVLQVQTEYHNILRDLNKKYELGINYLEMLFEHDFKEGIAYGGKNHLIVSPKLKVNDVRIALQYESLPEYHMTINDLLESYKNKVSINDVISTKDMNIRILDIENNEVVAVDVELLDNQLEVKQEEEIVEKIQWEDHPYSKVIPKPRSGKIIIQKEEEKEYVVLAKNITQSIFEDYLKQCEKYGFRELPRDDYYYMKDKDDYRLIMTYDEEKEELLLQVKEPLYSSGINVTINNKKSSNDEFMVNVYFPDEKLDYTWFDEGLEEYGIHFGRFYVEGNYPLKFEYEHNKDIYVETTFEVNGPTEFNFELDCYDDRIEIVNVEKNDE